MGRISPGPTRWPPGAERRLVPQNQTSNLKPVYVRHHGLLRLAQGVRCMRRAGQCLSCRRARPPVLAECVARSRFIGLYGGVLLGKVGSPGVVVADGRFRSRWFDAPCRVLWREEVIPRPSYRLPPCGWPVRDSRRGCTAVRCRCSAGGRLWWAGHACALSGGAGGPACS